MKTLRQLCAATVIASVLTVSAFAGHIECGVDDPPPPPPTAEGQTDAPPAANGEIECGLTGAVLTALEGVLSIL